jgi:hypothetical protein
MRCVASAEYTQFQSCEKKFVKKNTRSYRVRLWTSVQDRFHRRDFTAEYAEYAERVEKITFAVIPSGVERFTGEWATEEDAKKTLVPMSF